jgi:hypothetical protein
MTELHFFFLDFGLSWLTSLQFIQYHVAGFYKPTIPQSPPSHLFLVGWPYCIDTHGLKIQIRFLAGGVVKAFRKNCLGGSPILAFIVFL